MNKKKAVILVIIGLLIIGGIVGFVCYINSPDYVMEQYVKAINNGEYDKLEKYEYNYEDYEIKNAIGNYKIIIKSYRTWSENVLGEAYPFYFSMNYREVKNDGYKNISKTNVYLIDLDDDSFLLDNHMQPFIVIGKVGLRWKVVYSPFYYPE